MSALAEAAAPGGTESQARSSVQQCSEGSREPPCRRCQMALHCARGARRRPGTRPGGDRQAPQGQAAPPRPDGSAVARGPLDHRRQRPRRDPHGVNMVYKRPPYDPGAVGFDAGRRPVPRRPRLQQRPPGDDLRRRRTAAGKLRRRLPRPDRRRPAHARAPGDLQPDRLPPGPLQRALLRRGLSRLGGVRRRAAGRAADGLPRQLPRQPGRQPRLGQLLGRTRRARTASGSRSATRPPGAMSPSASAASPTCWATT